MSLMPYEVPSDEDWAEAAAESNPADQVEASPGSRRGLRRFRAWLTQRRLQRVAQAKGNIAPGRALRPKSVTPRSVVLKNPRRRGIRTIQERRFLSANSAR